MARPLFSSLSCDVAGLFLVATPNGESQHRYTNLKGIGNGTFIRVTPDVISSLYFPDTSEYYNKYGPRIIKLRTDVLAVICVA